MDRIDKEPQQEPHSQPEPESALQQQQQPQPKTKLERFLAKQRRRREIFESSENLVFCEVFKSTSYPQSKEDNVYPYCDSEFAEEAISKMVQLRLDPSPGNVYSLTYHYWRKAEDPENFINDPKYAAPSTLKRKNVDEATVHLADFHDVEPIPFNVAVDRTDHNFRKKPWYGLWKLTYMYCSNCGRNGTIIFACPRCRNAYSRFLKNISNDDLACNAEKTITVTETQDKPVESASVTERILPLITDEQGNLLSMKQLSEVRKFADVDRSHELKYIVDRIFCFMPEGERMFQVTDNVQKDLAKLVDKIGHLSVETQDTIVLHFLSECHFFKLFQNDRC